METVWGQSEAYPPEGWESAPEPPIRTPMTLEEWERAEELRNFFDSTADSD